MGTEAQDGFSGARATLRENVRWLATCFSGAVGIILAGTPFIGFGSLEIGSDPFRYAVIGLAVGTIALLAAIAYLFYILRPDVIYPNYVRQADVKGLGRLEGREIAALRKEFALRRDQMIPTSMTSVDALETEIEKRWQASGGDETTIDGKLWAHYRNNLRNVYTWATYARFHRRVRHGIVVVGLLALIAMAGLSVFAWHVVPKTQGKDGTAVTILNVMRTPDPRPSGQVRTVFFEPGKAELLSAALEIVEKVRADVRDRPRAVVIVYAYTDTMGTAAFNAKLARDRAFAVQRALTGPGGVARAQVLVAALPETNLPTITEDERSEPRNRAVDLVVAELPQPAGAASSGRR